MLTKNSNFNHLKSLSLSNFVPIEGGNKIGSIGNKLLTKMWLPQIEQINLSKYDRYSVYCKIGDEGTKHLAKRNWENLNQLHICNNDINKDGNDIKVGGLVAISSMSQWKELQTFIAKTYG